jgi:hypothetical protein
MQLCYAECRASPPAAALVQALRKEAVERLASKCCMHMATAPVFPPLAPGADASPSVPVVPTGQVAGTDATPPSALNHCIVVEGDGLG